MRKEYSLLIIILFAVIIIISNSSTSDVSRYNFKFFLGVEPKTEFIYSVKIVDDQHLKELFDENWVKNPVAFIPFGANEVGKKSRVIVSSTIFHENLTWKN